MLSFLPTSLTIGTMCPNCHKEIKRLKFVAVYGFCPHCEVHLYKKQTKKDNKPIPPTKKLIFSLFISLLVFVPLVLERYPNIQAFFVGMENLFFTALLIFLVMLLFFLIKDKLFAYGNYEKGVDYLKDLNKHPFFYNSQAVQCDNCQSFQMVDYHSYRHTLVMKDKEIPNQKAIENNPRFMGCIHCGAQYELIYQSSNLANLYALLSFVIIFANNFFHKIINSWLLATYNKIFANTAISFLLMKLLFFYCLCVFFIFCSFSFTQHKFTLKQVKLS